MEELLKEYRKTSIIIGFVIIALIFVVALIFMKIYLSESQTKVLQYKDNSELTYKVLLKENEFYNEEYVEEENQYVSDLIKNIEADFKYEFELDDNLPYNYDCEITATANVSDAKTGKTIYEMREPIVQKEGANRIEKLLINEKVKIDYNKYNDLMKKFVTQYDLKNVDSKLTVKMNVNINGDTKEFEKTGISIMDLVIPLTENTVSIDTNYEGLNIEKNIPLKNDLPSNKTWLYVSTTLLIIDFILLIALIIYSKKTETEEDKYRNEVRKIVSTYDSYISKIQDDFNMEGYQILKVASFVDLLEIRDTIHLPIIMLGNEEEFTTCFMIPTPNNILYFFSIGLTQYALPSGDAENSNNVSVSASTNLSEEKSDKNEK